MSPAAISACSTFINWLVPLRVHSTFASGYLAWKASTVCWAISALCEV
jgi:hypothetical protein